MQATSQVVGYRAGATELSGFLFSDPTLSHKSPGILVVHGGAGLDEHAKARAKALAELGFVTFACDMYGNGVSGSRDRIMARILELRADRTKLCQCAAAGVAVLSAHPQVDGRIAAVGYCFGGMTVLEAARSGMDLDGVVSVHGSLQTAHPAEAGAIKAKVLVCHGALDPHVPPPHVSAFAEEMKGAGADWQLNIYGGAMHGFTHENPSTTPGVAYNEVADKRSGEAIRAFFAELFGLTSIALTRSRATP